MDRVEIVFKKRREHSVQSSSREQVTPSSDSCTSYSTHTLLLLLHSFFSPLSPSHC